MRILVVDDEIMQLKSLKIGLRTEGHTVITALSGEEALEVIMAAPLPFELIITDYLMTGMNGMDLLKEVRKNAPFIPVILMTAYGKKELIIEAMRNECNGCIEKPFSLDQLVGEITRVQNRTMHKSELQDFDKSLAHIVHQINNPLVAILGSAQLAMHCPPDPETTKRRMGDIISASNQITKITKKILALGKEKTRLKEKVDIKWLLDDCLAMFESLLTQREISLQKKYAEGNLQVVGDPFALQQVFKNLLMNAIEAMDESTCKLLTVTTETDKTGLWITVQIADTGCGIPEASMKHFFNAATTTKITGHGIGLQVVKKTVEHHEGLLRLQSRDGQGTTIAVKLPACSCETTIDILHSKERQMNSSGNGAANQPK